MTSIAPPTTADLFPIPDNVDRALFFLERKVYFGTDENGHKIGGVAERRRRGENEIDEQERDA